MRRLTIIALFLVAPLLVACGQKGPLFFPEDESASEKNRNSEPAVRDIAPAPQPY